jgi:hypothetical protein
MCATWSVFSSSHHDRQPPSIRIGFTWRGSKRVPLPEDKCITRLDAVSSLWSHSVGNSLNRGLVKVMPPQLQLNHYKTQSREFFFAVKATRGASDNPAHEHVRNQGYWNRHEAKYSDVEDFALARQVLAYYAAKGVAGIP